MFKNAFKMAGERETGKFIRMSPVMGDFPPLDKRRQQIYTSATCTYNTYVYACVLLFIYYYFLLVSNSMCTYN